MANNLLIWNDTIIEFEIPVWIPEIWIPAFTQWLIINVYLLMTYYDYNTLLELWTHIYLPMTLGVYWTFLSYMIYL